MPRIAFVWALAALPLLGESTPAVLIETAALDQRLNEKDLVILHVGSEKDYSEGHIPGARLITLADISVTGERGLRLELPPAEMLTTNLGKLGIDAESTVVVYAAGAAPQAATRVWFTFDYLGRAEKTLWLNGGLPLWRTEGRAISTEAAAWELRTLKAAANPNVLADIDMIQARQQDSSIRLIDARLETFYSGEDKGEMSRGGHLPGAVNVPYPTLLDDKGRFRAANELSALLSIPAGQTPVTYCHIGQQATVPYFALRLLGLSPRLYDGSFQQWSAEEQLPVETAPAVTPAP